MHDNNVKNIFDRIDSIDMLSKMMKEDMYMSYNEHSPGLMNRILNVQEQVLMLAYHCNQNLLKLMMHSSDVEVVDEWYFLVERVLKDDGRDTSHFLMDRHHDFRREHLNRCNQRLKVIFEILQRNLSLANVFSEYLDRDIDKQVEVQEDYMEFDMRIVLKISNEDQLNCLEKY